VSSAVLVTVLVLGTLPTSALAHPLIDRARGFYEQAEFTRAYEALEEAERSGTLTRADLVDLLAQRALVHFARGNQGSMRTDLARLLSLEPGYRGNPEQPPSVLRVLEQLRGEVDRPIDLAAHARAYSEGVELTVEVVGDSQGLIDPLRIHTRVEEEPWESREGTSTVVNADAGARVAWYVEALGPGRAVIDTVGTQAAPFETRVLISEIAPPIVVTGESDFPWWTVAVGGAVLIGAGVVLLVLLIGNEADGFVVQSPTRGMP